MHAASQRQTSALPRTGERQDTPAYLTYVRPDGEGASVGLGALWHSVFFEEKLFFRV